MDFLILLINLSVLSANLILSDVSSPNTYWTFFILSLSLLPLAIAMLTDGLASLVVEIPLLITSTEGFVWHPILLLCIINGTCLSYQVNYFFGNFEKI